MSSTGWRTLRDVLVAVIGSLLVAVVGAVVGALVAIAITKWVVPDDPFLIIVFGVALLLLFVPLGAIGAVWTLTLVVDEGGPDA